MPTQEHRNQITHLKQADAGQIYATREQIAVRYAISKRKLDYLIKDGLIPSVRLGKRCLRIPIAKADACIESIQTGGIKSIS